MVRRLQRTIKTLLELHFGPAVVIEWPIAKGATDLLAQADDRYSPRVDVAVHTVGVTPGNHYTEISQYWDRRAPEALKIAFQGATQNANPRCMLAIEVVNSGSPKLILGDMTNASMMGLYGIVVPTARMETAVKRIFEYVRAVKSVGKAPEDLFENLRIIPRYEFLQLIAAD